MERSCSCASKALIVCNVYYAMNVVYAFILSSTFKKEPYRNIKFLSVKGFQRRAAFDSIYELFKTMKGEKTGNLK